MSTYEEIKKECDEKFGPLPSPKTVKGRILLRRIVDTHAASLALLGELEAFCVEHAPSLELAHDVARMRGRFNRLGIGGLLRDFRAMVEK